MERAGGGARKEGTWHGSRRSKVAERLHVFSPRRVEALLESALDAWTDPGLFRLRREPSDQRAQSPDMI
jgi:hypothetical protein